MRTTLWMDCVASCATWRTIPGAACIDTSLHIHLLARKQAWELGSLGHHSVSVALMAGSHHVLGERSNPISILTGLALEPS